MDSTGNNYYLNNVANTIATDKFQILNETNVTLTNQTKIANQTKGYVSCNHQNKLGFLLYRTGQAFCALAGKSDWQKARKLLVNELKSGHILKSNLDSDTPAPISKNKLNKMADLILKREVSVYQTAKSLCLPNDQDNLEGSAQYSFSPMDFHIKVHDISQEMFSDLNKMIDEK